MKQQLELKPSELKPGDVYDGDRVVEEVMGPFHGSTLVKLHDNPRPLTMNEGSVHTVTRDIPDPLDVALGYLREKFRHTPAAAAVGVSYLRCAIDEAERLARESGEAR